MQNQEVADIILARLKKMISFIHYMNIYFEDNWIQTVFKFLIWGGVSPDILWEIISERIYIPK